MKCGASGGWRRHNLTRDTLLRNDGLEHPTGSAHIFECGEFLMQELGVGQQPGRGSIE